MTLTLYDLLAQIVPTLVIAFGLGLYMRHWFTKLYTTLTTFKQTSATTADEQHTQTTLLQEMLRQLTEQTKVATIQAGPRLAQHRAAEAEQTRRREMTSFLINCGRFTDLNNQRRVLLALPPQVVAMVDAERYPTQNTAVLLQTIVQASGEYSHLHTLAAAVAAVLNGSDKGTEWAVRCAGWGIRLPPHEGDSDGT